MSLPWNLTADGLPCITLIKDATDRAMTVNQLRKLGFYIERLCKVRLLKHTQDSTLELFKKGDPITWSQINLYDITDEVFKLLIPFLLKEAGNHSNDKGCSWTELVASSPQPPEIMFSHTWSGRFRDMMCVINLLVEDKKLSVNTPIYICTMANNQINGEVLGDTVANFHFTRAINKAKSTVLIVDRMGASLWRTWCGLEVYWTINEDKLLQIYTPSGVVGGPRASSGALVEQIKCWDMKNTTATDTSYRRQIFNYVAQVPEHTGLLTTPKGKLRLDKGCRPMIDDSFCDHEETVYQERMLHFERLNKSVREKVTDCVRKEKISKGCSNPDIGMRGLTIGQWNMFVKTIQLKYPTQFDTVTYGFILEDFVQPIKNEHHCSYVEYIVDAPQKPEYYVETHNLIGFKDLAASINWFVEAQQLSDSTVLILEELAFSNDDWNESVCTKNTNVIEHVNNNLLIKALRECKGFVYVMRQDMLQETGIWRIVQVDTAVRLGLDLFLTTNTGVISCRHQFPGQAGYVFGSFNPGLCRVIMNIDVRKSYCGTNKSEFHRKMTESVHKYFQEIGDDVYDKIQQRFQRWCAGPVLLDATIKDDLEEIRRIGKIPGLTINSETLKGPHSESAIHIAAALGNISALEALIELKADPNVEDNVRERPLHYAAITGQYESCKVLLRAGADPLAESVFGETPLEVAKQNLAGYLGVKTTEVCRVLREAS